MGLRRRTLLTVGAVTALAVGGTIAVTGWSLWRAGIDRERERLDEAAAAGASVLAMQAHTLAGSTREYARWDNTWEFVHGQGEGYTTTDLVRESFTNLDVDMVLLGHGAAPAYAVFLDPEQAGTALTPVPERLGAVLRPRLAPASPAVGLVDVDGTPWLYVVEPITLSDGSGGDGQSMLIGRRLDAARLSPIAEVVRGSIELTAAEQPLAVAGGASVSGLASIDGVAGGGPWTLQLTRPSLRQAEFTRSLALLALAEAVVGLVAMTTMLVLVDRLVLRRLAALSDRTSHIRRDAPDARLPVVGADEFDQLAGEVNGLLDELAATGTLLRHDALHDPLTGLPNRTLLLDRIEVALAQAAGRTAQTLALLFLDLDRMKLVNDHLGHLVGDAFIRETALRLRSSVRSGDTVARLGGDEFAILLVDVGSAPAAIERARDILAAIRQPIVHADQEYVVTGSVGITLARRGAVPAELLREADVAMYAAKGAGRDQWALYDGAMHGQVLARLSIERALRRALADGVVAAWYQPIVSLKTRELLGFEALARWTDPEMGELPPSRFIPIAEETQLIAELDGYILDQALTALAGWSTTRAGLFVTVNHSARRFDAGDTVEAVGAALAAHGLASGALVLEVTETQFGRSEGRWATTLAKLSALGVRIALDDFGTGYSSLSRLGSCSVSILKLDRTFVQDLANGNGAVARAIVELAAELGMSVVAEGVETDEVAALLVQIGCTRGQGWLYSRALPFEEASRWVVSSPR